MFAIALCANVLACVVLQFFILYFVIKMYRQAEHWEPTVETRGHVVGHEARMRNWTRNMVDVGENQQSVPHNHHNPIEHDERQGKCVSFLIQYFLTFISGH